MRAFEGAEAVFTLLAYDVQAPGYRARQDGQGEAIVEAMRAAGIRHVVFLSSLGADQPTGTGLIESLRAQEERLRGMEDTHVVMLRPGAFFENFHAALPLIRQDGSNGDAFRPDLAIPMVATRDVADVAAAALMRRDWTGAAVRELRYQRVGRPGGRGPGSSARTSGMPSTKQVAPGETVCPVLKGCRQSRCLGSCPSETASLATLRNRRPRDHPQDRPGGSSFRDQASRRARRPGSADEFGAPPSRP